MWRYAVWAVLLIVAGQTVFYPVTWLFLVAFNVITESMMSLLARRKRYMDQNDKIARMVHAVLALYLLPAFVLVMGVAVVFIIFERLLHEARSIIQLFRGRGPQRKDPFA